MQRLFLASLFNGVSDLFLGFTGEELKGKTVTFIPTASVPEKVNFFVGSGRKALLKLGLTVDELEISTATADEISGKLRRNDYIYVTGGNTFFLLQELKRTGADKIILQQIEAGKLYIGESAGAMIVSPNIEYAKGLDDCKKAPELDGFAALNAVEIYPLPHHTNQPFKRAVEKIIDKYGADLPLRPISNSQAILVNGNDISIKSQENGLMRQK
ncbi:putative peptidase Lmo0363 [Clostridia bacterium]|nr:putative peptidase Lmo0363 [Clostridia bacterium]